MAKRKAEQLIEEFYLMALHDIADGASIRELEKAMKYYESIEDYEACAGIHKAIQEVKTQTLTAIKTKINEIRKNKRSS